MSRLLNNGSPGLSDVPPKWFLEVCVSTRVASTECDEGSAMFSNLLPNPHDGRMITKHVSNANHNIVLSSRLGYRSNIVFKDFRRRDRDGFLNKYVHSAP